jgi:hypothetical protein
MFNKNEELFSIHIIDSINEQISVIPVFIF